MSDSTTTPAAEPSTEPAPTTPEVPAPTTARTYDEDYVKTLRSEAAGYRTTLRTKEQEAADLAAKVQTYETERPTLETRATAAELQAARYEVALEKGLTKDLAKRLIGATREEMEADAEALKASIGSVTPPADLGQGARTPAPAPKPGVNEALRRLAGGK